MIRKARYKFVHNRRKLADAPAKIELYVYFASGSKTYLDTGIAIMPPQWNGNQVVKHPRKDFYNAELNRFRSLVENEEHRLYMMGQELTAIHIKNMFAGVSPDLFSTFCRSQIMHDSGLKYVTKIKQLRFVEILEAFRPDVCFADINYQLIHDFDKHLQRSYAPNTVLRLHKDFKKYIRLAINFNLMNYENNPYLKFKTGTWQNKTDFLYPWQVDAIAALNLSEVKRLHIAQQMFLFACFTGLRHSDLHTLNASSFEQRPEGLVLNLSSQKTNSRVFLRLYEMFAGRPQAIIMPFYKANQDKKYIWGMLMQNAATNLLLKEVGTLAKLEKPLTTHLARHTFGTSYARATGSIFEVMRAMGITKYETAQVYINLAGML